jgi:hypothetical protein
MLWINKNTSNQLTVELFGLTTSTYDQYLFQFIPENTTIYPNRWWFAGTGGTATCRSIQFTLVESSTGSTGSTGATAGVAVNLTPGEWQYNVYAGTAAINWANMTAFTGSDPIWRGTMTVTGTNTFLDTLYDGAVDGLVSSRLYD